MLTGGRLSRNLEKNFGARNRARSGSGAPPATGETVRTTNRKRQDSYSRAPVPRPGGIEGPA